MPEYERLHVQLIERSSQALRDAVAIEGTTKTEVVNHALQLYAWLLNRRVDGAALLIQDPDGTTERVRIL